MTLSPADFSAYSQATGTDYPRNAEERARLAPNVRDFRRNQLKQKESEPEQDNIVANSLLGLGILGAIGMGARKLLQAPVAKKPAAGVTVANLSDIQRVAAAKVPTERTQQILDTKNVDDFVRGKTKTLGENFLVATPEGFKEFSQRAQQVPAAVPPSKPLEAPSPVIDEAGRTQRQNKLFQEFGVVDQQQEAFQSGADQMVGRAERNIQRDTDFVGTDSNTFETAVSSKTNLSPEQLAVVENSGREAQQNLLNYMEQRGLTSTNTIEDLIEDMGQDPLVQGFFKYGDPQKDFAAPNLMGEEVITQTARKAKTRSGAPATRTTTRRTLVGPLESDVNINQRIMGAVTAKNEGLEEISDLLLNPNVSTKQLAQIPQVRQFLGELPQIRGGAVSPNPTMEVAGGARASMGGVRGSQIGATVDVNPNRADDTLYTTSRRYDQQGKVYDPNTGNYTGDFDQPSVDPTELMSPLSRETDFGDTEGVGNILVDTEAFRERTNKSTTMIPGKVSAAVGGARSTSESEFSPAFRQEREMDTVLPVRRSAEGVQIAGLRPRGSGVPTGATFQARQTLVGTGQLAPKNTATKYGIEVDDINVGSNKLPGGFEVGSTSVVSDFISTQPVEVPRVSEGVDSRGVGFVTDAAGNKFATSTLQKDLSGQAPLIGRTPNVKLNQATGQLAQLPWTQKERAKGAGNPQAVSLPRQQLETLASDAADAFYNNINARKQYAQKFFSRARDKDALRLINQLPFAQAESQLLASGKILDKAYLSNFTADYIDNSLRNTSNITLDILQPVPTKYGGYYGADTNAFVDSLRKTFKETQLFGNLLSDVNRQGRSKADKMPLQGRTSIRGSGGTDPMAAVEQPDYKLAYYQPRVGITAPQRVQSQLQSYAQGVLGEPAVNPMVEVNAALRQQMQTPIAGYRIPRPGSFARTNNPYTNQAAAASGPAGRALEGNYQYAPQQLEVDLAEGIRFYDPRQNQDTIDTYTNLSDLQRLEQAAAKIARRRAKRGN